MTIVSLQAMQKQLIIADDFFHKAKKTAGQFTIMNMPLYYIEESIPSVASFHEYKDKILSFLDSQEDILSNMVRMVSFDETGYKSSQMYLVKPVTDVKEIKNKTFLKDGKCLHTTFIAKNNDVSVMEKMFVLSHQFAKEHDLKFYGVAYIFIRFVRVSQQTDQNAYEVWIPLK